MMSAQAPTRDAHRCLLATVQESRGAETEALRAYESLSWSPWLEALGYLRAGQLRARRDEIPAALGDNRRFLALWDDADSQPQPQVQQARSALDRLERTAEG